MTKSVKFPKGRVPLSNFTKLHSFQTAPRLGWQVLLVERCDTRGSPIWQGADSTRGGGQGGFFLTSPAPKSVTHPLAEA